MKVIAGILGENPRLAKTYSRISNMSARIVLGGTLFEVGNVFDYGVIEEKFTFSLSPIIRDKDFSLYLECSDGKENSLSWMSFGCNGERLGPFHIFNKEDPFKSLYYSLKGITQFLFFENEKFILSKSVLRRKNHLVFYKKEIIWQGFIDEPIPSSLFMLEPTIRLAFDTYTIENNPKPVSKTTFPIFFNHNNDLSEDYYNEEDDYF